jgi:uncharacterized membrane protein YbhN (UPF0104 family)
VTANQRANAPERADLPAGRPLARWVKTLRWLLALVLVVLAVRLLASDPAPVRMLAQIRVSTGAAMILLIVFNQWLTAWRFQIAMKQCAGADVTRAQWFRLIAVGQFLSLVVPQLGHVYRAWALERQHGVEYADYATGAFIFFWFELLTGLGLACAVVTVQDTGFMLGSLPVLVPLSSGFVLLLTAPALAIAIVRRIPLGGGWPSRLIQRVASSFAKARAALADSGFILQYVALNVGVAAVHAAILWLAFDTVGGPFSFGRLMLFQVLLKLTSFVQVTPGNIGLTELAYGVLAEAASGAAQRGIAASLLIRGVGLPVTVALGVALGGLAFLHRQGREAMKH